MKITTTVRLDIDSGGDDELEQRVLALAQEEILRYSAALADRLEEEGIADVEIDVKGDS
jgi:hypothetical protein